MRGAVDFLKEQRDGLMVVAEKVLEDYGMGDADLYGE